MANIDISDGSTYVVGVTDSSWVGADGDAITIDGGSEVIIDADQYVPTNKWGGEIKNINNGIFRIKNAGTNGRMLVFEFNTITTNFRIERKGQLIVEGDWLEVATGDGTSGQTIDFSSVGTNNVSLDVVETIWIEKTPNGEKYPFMSLGDPSADAYNMPLAGVSGSQGTGASGFGGAGASSDWAVGRNFNFNRSTKVATFGDGTNGLVIPNGCKAYINNIQITGTYNSDYRQRSKTDLNPEGTLSSTNAEWTSSIHVDLQQAGDVLFRRSSVCEKLYSRDIYGDMIFNDFALTIDTRRTYIAHPFWDIQTPQTSNGQLDNVFADLNLRGVSSNRYGISMHLNGFTKFENIYWNLVDKDSPDYLAVLYYIDNLTMKNVNTVDYISANHLNNCILLDWKYRGTTFAPAFTSYVTNYRQYGLRLGGISNGVKIINFQHVQDSTPPGYLIDVQNACQNVEIYNAVNYATDANGVDWGNSGIRQQGDNNIVKNCELNGGYSAYILYQDLDAGNCVYDNIYGDVGKRSYYGLGKCFTNMVENHNRDYPMSGLPSDVGIVLNRARTYDSGTAPNIVYGGLIMMDGGAPRNNSYYHEIGGGAYIAQGDTKLPNIGSYVAMGNKQPLRGFKGFLDPTGGSTKNRLNTSGLTWNNTTISFKISLADDDLPSAWTEITGQTGTYHNAYTQLQNAFDAIKGANYDSNKGINFACKVENAGSPDPARTFYYINFFCEIDNDYVANDASITFAGGATTEKYEVIKASDNSVLYTFIGTGTHDFYLSTYYQEDVYFKRYKYVNGSYVLLVSTEYETQKLDYGFNGIILLYTGAEVQVASTDIQAIWAYSQRTLTEGFTATDRETINKALTTGKFLALK